MTKGHLANITLQTDSNYDQRRDSFYMDIPDYHELLKALEAGKIYQFQQWYCHKDATATAKPFYYQERGTTTFFPNRLLSMRMLTVEVEKGEL